MNARQGEGCPDTRRIQASLVAIVVIMNAVGLPPEAIAVLFVFDRILDMSRTVVNIYGDAAYAVIVAHRSGETGLLEPDVPADRPAMPGKCVIWTDG